MINIKLKDVPTRLSEKKVYYDPAFQRRVVWDKNDINKYFESLSRGWANAPISLASVEDCLEHSINVGDQVSVDYFKNLSSKGYKYVSIDGQNRTKKATEVMSNKTQLSGDNFCDSDSNRVDKVVNKFIKDLENDPASSHYLLAHNLKHSTVPLVIYRNITREQCAEIFRNINRTKQPNAHNIRQSRSTPIAEYVRKLRKDLKSSLERVVVAKYIPDMQDDELIAKSLMVLVNKYNDEAMNKAWDLKEKDLNVWYEKGVGFYNIEDPNCPYIPSELERAGAIIKETFRTIMNQKVFPNSKLIPMEQYWSLLSACAWAYDNSFYIKDPEVFFQEIREIHVALKSKSEATFHKDRNNAEDPDSIREKDYYFRQCTTFHVSSNRTRMLKNYLVPKLNRSAFKSLRMKQFIAAK